MTSDRAGTRPGPDQDQTAAINEIAEAEGKVTDHECYLLKQHNPSIYLYFILYCDTEFMSAHGEDARIYRREKNSSNTLAHRSTSSLQGAYVGLTGRFPCVLQGRGGTGYCSTATEHWARSLAFVTLLGLGAVLQFLCHLHGQAGEVPVADLRR